MKLLRATLLVLLGGLSIPAYAGLAPDPETTKEAVVQVYGARTMGELRRRGGRTIAEAEETAVVWGMPGELVKAGGADVVAPLDRIAGRLIDLVASA